MGLEHCQPVDQLGNFLFQLHFTPMLQCIIPLYAKDKRIYGHMEKFGKLYELIYRTAFCPGFDPAQMTPIHIQRFGQLVLGVPVLDTQVLYVRAAALHVIVYL